MTERGQAVVLVVGGMLIGAGVATLVLKKHYQKIADEEIASVKTTYKEHYDRLNDRGDIQDVKEDDADEDGNPWVTKAPGVPPVAAPIEPTLYNKVPTSEEKRAEAEKLAANLGYSTQTEETPESINVYNMERYPAPEFTPAQEEELDAIIEGEQDDPNVPTIIPVADYMEGMDGFESITLTYYEGDRQLCDDGDNLITDIRNTVGFGNLEKFGKLSGNGDTVYIRNYQRKVDYEVCRERGKYQDEVLNVGSWDDEDNGPKIRKFRHGD